MDSLRIEGGVPLKGRITVSGAKNAALPLMAAGLATSGTLQLENVPRLVDTQSMEVLLANHGMDVSRDGLNVSIRGAVTNVDAPYELVRRMRASVLVLGPLLARYGEARVSLPGGCAIGTRPVDLHIRAMQALGAVVELADGYIQARAPGGLKGGRVVFPGVSVGATENAMIAASLAKGTSELVNVAREPEISDLAECLNAMGARITGHGSDTIMIEGVDELGDATHRVIPDRIEAGTWAIAAAITGGDLFLEHARRRHLDALLDVIVGTGAAVDVREDGFQVTASGRPRAVDITTDPFPGFPTDLQAPFMALMSTARGTSVISEKIYENRLQHVAELQRMGAAIRVDGSTAIVQGVPSLSGAPVTGSDLRAAAAMVLAGLSACGTTQVSGLGHLDRGYDNVEAKLRGVGATVERDGF